MKIFQLQFYKLFIAHTDQFVSKTFEAFFSRQN